VKAAYTKCVRAVWAADGGQRESAPPPTRESDSFLFARDSGVGLFSRALVVLESGRFRFGLFEFETQFESCGARG